MEERQKTEQDTAANRFGTVGRLFFIIAIVDFRQGFSFHLSLDKVSFR
jgi:hypothetical protein